jgi:hypothetical protein
LIFGGRKPPGAARSTAECAKRMIINPRLVERWRMKSLPANLVF